MAAEKKTFFRLTIDDDDGLWGIFIIRADDVVQRRRGYSDHFVTRHMGMSVCGWLWGVYKTKTPDRNALKLGTVVVLDNLSKTILILCSKGQGPGVQYRIR